MTGADLIQMLSILIEVIIAAGAVFIAVKKKNAFRMGSLLPHFPSTCASTFRRWV